MVNTGGAEHAERGSGGSGKLRSRGGLKSGSCSTTADDERFRAVKATLLERFGPHERLLTYLQSVLVWERPFHCVLLYAAANVMFWTFALSDLRMLCLMASGLALAVCADTWRNKIWPKIKVKRQDDSEHESWGLVQPGTLSVPELCHHMAETWVVGSSWLANVRQYKRNYPGKFCLLVCGLFTILAYVGCYIPGLGLSYLIFLGILLFPLVMYYHVWQHVCVMLEPALQWLDFRTKGYMMSKPIDNQFLRKPIRAGTSDEASDSEEELAGFCPVLDAAVVAKELALTDSEHSDAEVSFMDNGTFNLSRGQTPLTEGSEDLDRHSDPEESFACGLPDFPSINPDATLMDDDDDASIGLPSLNSAALSGPRGSTSTMLDLDTQMDSDQDDLYPDLSLGSINTTSDLTSNLAGVIASNMIQAAIAGAMQPRPPQGARRQSGPRPGPPRGYRKQSSSELDTDVDFDGEDFEMLDQSELNQLDPFAGGQAGQNRTQGSSFLSNFLGKPQ